MKDTLERWLGTIFGLIFVALSLIVAVETAIRKLFNVSLQGADELGGYALAVGATIAFSMALIGRNHIRVDVFYGRFPAVLKTAINWLSALSLAGFAGLLAWLAWFVIQDSRSYQSVSQTPWATPLVYPQTAWLIGLIIFGLLTAGIAVYSTWLLLTGRIASLNALLQPRSATEELKEELDDLQTRAKGEAA
jgi:TRAP-type C4-dicarboxylate transport system permease small subunit